MKAVSEWLRNTVFSDEAIRPRTAPPTAEKLPAILRTARSLEAGSGQIWQSRESIFLKQAKLLADYTDDYNFEGTVRCYYPTYQSLTDRELRGYFSWRTKLRAGNVQKTSLSFAYIYIYELINQIGVETPMEGYKKLQEFRDIYGRIDEGVPTYLENWLADYVIYYDLDPELLAETPQVRKDHDVSVLAHVAEEPPEKIIEAVKRLSGKYLERSKFYGENTADMDAVIVPVLRRISAHYASRCKKSMVEQYFGRLEQYIRRPFESAVFTDPLKRKNYEYDVDEQCTYVCENGLWSVWKRAYTTSGNKALHSLLKTIDSMMREAYGSRHPIQPGTDTKWIVKIIGEEIQNLLAEKKAAETKKVTIHFDRLTKIRQDAEITQEKLIVEEETAAEPDIPEDPPAIAPPAPEAPEGPPLTSAEFRLLRCLLYGGSLDWVKEEGHLLSVLTDGINEKLYDTFLDTVLDDGPQVIEDYIDDLKEMVRP